MADLTVYDRTTDPTFVVASVGGDEFVNDGATELLIINGGVSDVQVTVVGQGRCSEGFLHDMVATVSAGHMNRLGPFNHSRYGDPQRKVSMTYDSVLAVSVSAQRQK